MSNPAKPTGPSDFPGSGHSQTLRSFSNQALGENRLDPIARRAIGGLETLPITGGQIVEKVRTAASDLIEKKAGEHKDAAADYLGDFAEGLRRSAKHFEPDGRIVSEYISKAALNIDKTAENLRTGDFQKIISRAQDFVRQRPGTVAAFALLAGFAAIRLVKSSSSTAVESLNGRSVNQPRPEQGFLDGKCEVLLPTDCSSPKLIV